VDGRPADRRRLAARLKTVRGTALVLASCGGVSGIAFGFSAVFPLVAVLAIGYLFGGLVNGIQNVCQSALIRARTSQDLRGRAFSGSRTAINATGTVDNVLSGLLVTVIGARGCFAVAAGLCLLTGLVALAVNLRITVPGTRREQRTARTV
jgi:MFS family permease